MWRIDRENQSSDATCARDEETKKDRERNQNVQSKTAYSPRPATSSDRNEILHGGWSPGDSSRVRISLTSVKRFRSCGGGVEICPFPLTWPSIDLYNSLYYRASRDNGMQLFHLKISPSHGGSGTPSNPWFPGPTRVLNPNGISIGSAVFATV